MAPVNTWAANQADDAHRRTPPDPPVRVPRARLAGRDGRSRRQAACDANAGAHSAPPQAQPRGGLARPARARWRRPDPDLAQTRRRNAPRRPLRRDPRWADHRAAAAPAVHARNRNAGRSLREHAALRALPIERHLLHAMRGRGFPPHHLFPGPAGRDVGLHHPHRGGQSRNPGAARQRQPAPRAAICRAAGISRSGTIRGRSRPTCSPWSAASSAASRTVSSPCPGAKWRSASTSSPARRIAAATPWTRSSARCAGTSRRSAANTISTCS